VKLLYWEQTSGTFFLISQRKLKIGNFINKKKLEKQKMKTKNPKHFHFSKISYNYRHMSILFPQHSYLWDV
jgi:hypothetical protein